MERTYNLNIEGFTPMISPRDLKGRLPLTEGAAKTVSQTRREIGEILSGEDQRLLAVVGPCSIHNVNEAMEYAELLADARERYGKVFCLVMRVYFEKPRTINGWKGLINDPFLDGSCKMEKGIFMARQLLLRINELGVPAGTEFLDPLTPPYISDLVSWAAIGARTTESQTHREMASGLSMPVGFKNATNGDVQPAINALLAAQTPHVFWGINQDARVCRVKTRGNSVGHLILRGGGKKTNFDGEAVREICGQLAKVNLPCNLAIDCSHGNSYKNHKRQVEVFREVIRQSVSGSGALMGLMLESNLEEGSQPINLPLSELKHGVSVTDACISWAQTEELLREAYEKLLPTMPKAA